jgi:hypothetical protein
MGLAFEVAGEDCVSYFCECLGVEVPVDEFVGVDHDEGRPDIGEDVVLAVAFDEVAQDFRLVEDVHLAHVGVELSLGHFEGVLEGGDDSYASFVGLSVVLYALVFEGANRDAFEEGLAEVLLGRR